MSQAVTIEHELKELQVNTVRYKLLVIEFAGMVNHETLRGIPAKLSSISYNFV